jgi:hypothetical protein
MLSPDRSVVAAVALAVVAGAASPGGEPQAARNRTIAQAIGQHVMTCLERTDIVFGG